MARSALLLVAVALFGCGRHDARENTARLAAKQMQVEERGRSVMPFDINRTMHHFKKTATGGEQEVLATDGDAQQISLIRKHLRSEAVRFQHGDFSDPSSIHGTDMPGVRALAAGARRIDIRYGELPGGARITYVTDDPTLVTAIHRWFDAQVRQHGRHAMPM